MSKIGQLTVDLRLVSQKFTQGLKKANGSLNNFRNQAQKATRSLGGVKAGLAGVLGVAGISAMVNQSLKSADALAKMSDRLNISTESLSAFQHLVQLNGATSEQFEKGLQRMARSIGEAEQGFGTGKRALDTLGISIEELNGLSADQQFIKISEAISKVESSSQQAAISSDLFGRAGVELLNTIRQGEDGFNKAAQEVDKYGLAISRVEAAKIEAANDAILRAQQSMKGAALIATQELSPFLEQVANEFVQMGQEGEGFKGIFKNVVESTLVGVGHVKNAFAGLRLIFNLVELGVKKMASFWADALDGLVNKVIIPFANNVGQLLISPLKSVLSFAAKFSDTAKDMLGSVDEALKFENVKGLSDFADSLYYAAEDAKLGVSEALIDIVPVEQIRENLNTMFEEAEERAKEAVENVQKNSAITYDDETDNKEQVEDNKQQKAGEYDFILDKEKSFGEKMAQLKTGSSKKLAAITKAAALKEAIVTGFAAIQKAWNSAPFPENIPAVALTTLGVAGNVQAIRGQAHSGIDYVPREGTWLLDKGERVIDSRTNADLKGFLNGGGNQTQTSSNTTINMSFVGRKESEIMDEMKMVKKPLMRMIQSLQGAPI